MLTESNRPYDRVHALLQTAGGSMTWMPKGMGGDWLLQLHGRSASISCRDRKINALDNLYVSNVINPTTWADYDPDAPLVRGAFWKLIDLFR